MDIPAGSPWRGRQPNRKWGHRLLICLSFQLALVLVCLPSGGLCQASTSESSSSSSKSGTRPKTPRDEHQIELRKRLHLMGFPYTRHYGLMGALDFTREQYIEPWWNRSHYEVRLPNGKQLEFSIHSGLKRESLTLDRYVLEALDQLYKNRLIQAHIHTYDDQADRARSMDPNLVSRSKCMKHLDYLEARAEEYKGHLRTGDRKFTQNMDPELAAFFDSYANEEAGLLTGNVVWLGHWRECQQRKILDMRPFTPDGPTQFEGRYCIASIRSANWSSLIREKSDRMQASGYFKYPNQADHYDRSMNIQVGMCLPQSCDPAIHLARPKLIRELATLRLSEPFRDYQLTEFWCMPDPGSEVAKLDSASWLFVSFWLVWLTICVGATLIDRQQPGLAEKPLHERSSYERLVSSLSISRNWSRVMRVQQIPHHGIKRVASTTTTTTNKKDDDAQPEVTTETSGHQVEVAAAAPSGRDLSYLDFFKCLFLICIMLGHVTCYMFQTAKFGLQQRGAVGHTYWINTIASMSYFVDNFWIMSGLIVTYGLFTSNRVLKTPLIGWCYLIFHRYVRLMPLMLLVNWFSKSLLKHVASGPIWDYGLTSITMRRRCAQSSSIWPALLMTNWQTLHQQCLIPSWSVSNDMQFFLFTPFLLVGLAKFPKTTWLASVASIVACLVARYHYYMTSPNARYHELTRVLYDAYLRTHLDHPEAYTQPHYRFTSYLIGILGGHYAYMVRTGQWSSYIYTFTGQETMRTKWCRKLVFLVGVAMTIYSYIFSVFLEQMMDQASDFDAMKSFVSLCHAIHFNNAAIFFVLISVTILLGELAPIRRQFMEAPIWQRLSRFNYPFLLVHHEWIYIIIHSNVNVSDLNTRHLVLVSLSVAFFSYLTSVFLSILFELPIGQLESQFIAAKLMGGPRAASNRKKGDADVSRSNDGPPSPARIMHDDDDQQVQDGSSGSKQMKPKQA